MADKNGFTLVELIVVVAIVAILAAVATPAYINYVNRSKQGGAESLLMTARLEEEEFYTDNQRYTGTIRLLPSFANTSMDPTSGYTFSVGSTVTASYYMISANRKFHGIDDYVYISANTNTPWVLNTTALKFSVFKWLFGQ